MGQASRQAKEDLSFPVWSSRLLTAAGVLHFFTTRLGGVSPDPFDTLNLGFSSGDDRENVIANRKRVEERFNVELKSLAIQVHGNDVLVLKSKEALPNSKSLPEADAILTNITSLAVPVFFADCLPIFLWDPVHKAGGLAHAGWRSTLKDVGPLSVEALGREFGSKPGDLLVALAPSIGPCCFEVGPEVAGPFQQKFGEAVVLPKGKKTFVNLWEANRLALTLKGVNAVNMELANECTSCLRERYFSYRRDQGKTGRMAGVLVITDELR